LEGIGDPLDNEFERMRFIHRQRFREIGDDGIQDAELEEISLEFVSSVYSLYCDDLEMTLVSHQPTYGYELHPPLRITRRDVLRLHLYASKITDLDLQPNYVMLDDNVSSLWYRLVTEVGNKLTNGDFGTICPFSRLMALDTTAQEGRPQREIITSLRDIVIEFDYSGGSSKRALSKLMLRNIARIQSLRVFHAYALV